MFTIRGLPAIATKADVKRLIEEQCKLEDFMVGDMVFDGGGTQQTRIGVADKDDGTVLMTSLNEFRIGDSVLEVLPYVKPKNHASNTLPKVFGIQKTTDTIESTQKGTKGKMPNTKLVSSNNALSLSGESSKPLFTIERIETLVVRVQTETTKTLEGICKSELLESKENSEREVPLDTFDDKIIYNFADSLANKDFNSLQKMVTKEVTIAAKIEESKFYQENQESLEPRKNCDTFLVTAVGEEINKNSEIALSAESGKESETAEKSGEMENTFGNTLDTERIPNIEETFDGKLETIEISGTKEMFESKPATKNLLDNILETAKIEDITENADMLKCQVKQEIQEPFEMEVSFQSIMDADHTEDLTKNYELLEWQLKQENQELCKIEEQCEGFLNTNGIEEITENAEFNNWLHALPPVERRKWLASNRLCLKCFEKHDKAACGVTQDCEHCKGAHHDALVCRAKESLQPAVKVLQESKPTMSKQPLIKCFYCKVTTHTLKDCDAFSKLTRKQRKTLRTKLQLCFRCLGQHDQKACPDSVMCEKCNKTQLCNEHRATADKPAQVCVHCLKVYHKVRDCLVFRAKPPAKRREWLALRGLCLKCFEKHDDAACEVAEICKICEGPLPHKFCYKTRIQPAAEVSQDSKRTTSNQPLAKCSHCEDTTHTLQDCDAFAKLSVQTRLMLRNHNQLCVRCLGQHNKRHCQAPISCERCDMTSHHTLFCRVPEQYLPKYKVTTLKKQPQVCIHCQKGGHKLRGCQVFLALSRVKRREWLASSGLCLKCFEKHDQAACEAAEVCEHCKGADHDTLVCGAEERPQPAVEVSQTPKKPPQVCGLCQKRDHKVRHCRVFRAQTRAKRREWLASSELCLKCFEKHDQGACEVADVCKNCKGVDHNTLVCGPKLKPRPAVDVSQGGGTTPPNCVYCKTINQPTNHAMIDCKTFSRLATWFRRSFVKANELCFKCCENHKQNYCSRQLDVCHYCKRTDHCALLCKPTDKQPTDLKAPQGGEMTPPNCVYCKTISQPTNHAMIDCKMFSKLATLFRRSFVRANELCFKCCENHKQNYCSRQLDVCFYCKSTDHCVLLCKTTDKQPTDLKAPQTPKKQPQACLHCQKRDHNLRVCQVFLEQSPAKRREWLASSGLCLKCFEKHDRAACEVEGEVCKHCKGADHDTLVCGAEERPQPAVEVSQESKSKKPPQVCVRCQKGDHNVRKCLVFLAHSRAKRHEWLASSGLCLKCFEKHDEAACEAAEVCEHCKGADHDVLVCGAMARQQPAVVVSQGTSLLSKLICTYCLTIFQPSNHAMIDCKIFSELGAFARWNFAKSKRICFKCCGNHHRDHCKSSDDCRNCKRSDHCMLLCMSTHKQPTNSVAPQTDSSLTANNQGNQSQFHDQNYLNITHTYPNAFQQNQRYEGPPNQNRYQSSSNWLQQAYTCLPSEPFPNPEQPGLQSDSLGLHNMSYAQPGLHILSPQQPGLYNMPPQQPGLYNMPPQQPGLYNMPPQQPGLYNMPPQQPGLYNMPPQQPGLYNMPPQQPGLYNMPPQQPGLYNMPPQQPGLYNMPPQQLGLPNMPPQQLGQPNMPPQQLGLHNMPLQQPGLHDMHQSQYVTPPLIPDADSNSKFEFIKVGITEVNESKPSPPSAAVKSPTPMVNDKKQPTDSSKPTALVKAKVRNTPKPNATPPQIKSQTTPISSTSLASIKDSICEVINDEPTATNKAAIKTTNVKVVPKPLKNRDLKKIPADPNLSLLKHSKERTEDIKRNTREKEKERKTPINRNAPAARIKKHSDDKIDLRARSSQSRAEKAKCKRSEILDETTKSKKKTEEIRKRKVESDYRKNLSNKHEISKRMTPETKKYAYDKQGKPSTSTPRSFDRSDDSRKATIDPARENEKKEDRSRDKVDKKESKMSDELERNVLPASKIKKCNKSEIKKSDGIVVKPEDSAKLSEKTKRFKVVSMLSRRILLDNEISPESGSIYDRIYPELSFYLLKVVYKLIGDQILPMKEILEMFREKYKRPDVDNMFQDILAGMPKSYKRLKTYNGSQDVPAKLPRMN